MSIKSAFRQAVHGTVVKSKVKKGKFSHQTTGRGVPLVLKGKPTPLLKRAVKRRVKANAQEGIDAGVSLTRKIAGGGGSKADKQKERQSVGKHAKRGTHKTLFGGKGLI